MLNRMNQSIEKKVTNAGRTLAIVAGALVFLLVLISCGTVERKAVQLPNVPGATYIGSKECEQCHAQIYRDFGTADHARLIAQGTNAVNVGCESCHGPASLHAQSGGEAKPPFGFTSGRPQSSSFAAREPVSNYRESENLCFQCHFDVRGQFSLPSHH